MKNSLPITPPSSFSLPHILQRKERSRRNNAPKGSRAETKTQRLAARIRRENVEASLSKRQLTTRRQASTSAFRVCRLLAFDLAGNVPFESWDCCYECL